MRLKSTMHDVDHLMRMDMRVDEKLRKRVEEGFLNFKQHMSTVRSHSHRQHSRSTSSSLITSSQKHSCATNSSSKSTDSSFGSAESDNDWNHNFKLLIDIERSKEFEGVEAIFNTLVAYCDKKKNEQESDDLNMVHSSESDMVRNTRNEQPKIHQSTFQHAQHQLLLEAISAPQENSLGGEQSVATLSKYDQNHLHLISQITAERYAALVNLEMETEELVEVMHDINKLAREHNRVVDRGSGTLKSELLETVAQNVESANRNLEKGVASLRNEEVKKNEEQEKKRKKAVKRFMRDAVLQTCTIS